MANYDKIVDRLNQLIKRGENVLSTVRNHGGIIGEEVDNESFIFWRTNVVSCLTTVFLENSHFVKSFDEKCKHNEPYNVKNGLGILKAAKDEVENGFLAGIEDLVAADIFTDLLEMAEYLLENGYKDPAASLIGAVLEDGLRKISKKNDITLKTKENISSLNQKITDKEVYNRIIYKQVQTWNELRNNADHGEFEEYDVKQVDKMLEFVRDFLGKYL